MSSYYSQSCNIESQGLAMVMPFVTAIAKHEVTTITDDAQQQRIGDLAVGSKIIEVKIERKYTGNLFVETWSNREWGKPGWLHTCHSDLLLYYFLDTDQLFCMSLPALTRYLSTLRRVTDRERNAAALAASLGLGVHYSE